MDLSKLYKFDRNDEKNEALIERYKDIFNGKMDNDKLLEEFEGIALCDKNWHEDKDDEDIITKGDIMLILPLDGDNNTLYYEYHLKPGKYTCKKIIKILNKFYHQTITLEMYSKFKELLADNKSPIRDMRSCLSKEVKKGTAILKSFPYIEVSIEASSVESTERLTKGVYWIKLTCG